MELEPRAELAPLGAVWPDLPQDPRLGHGPAAAKKALAQGANPLRHRPVEEADAVDGRAVHLSDLSQRNVSCQIEANGSLVKGLDSQNICLVSSTHDPGRASTKDGVVITQAEVVLRQVFGLGAFRRGQAEAVEAMLAGRDIPPPGPPPSGQSPAHPLPPLLRSAPPPLRPPLPPP